MKKKILSFLLSAAMAITGIGVGAWEPVTVYAEGEAGSAETEDPTDPAEPWMFEGIFIDQEGFLFGDSEIAEDAYFNITDENHVEDVTEAAKAAKAAGESFTGYKFRYCRTNHTLTLNGMEASISAGSVITSEYGRNSTTDKLTINLIGTNTLGTTADGCSAIYLNGSTVITGSALNVTGGKKTGDWCPAAISVDSRCAIFTNGATITTTVDSAGEVGFSAWTLSCGDPKQQYKIDIEGQEVTGTVGRIVNYGTVNGNGMVGLCDGMSDGLVSLNTEYQEPICGQKHTHIGKAYIWSKGELYPNNILNLREGDYRIIGKYDANGEPIPSNVYYEYSYWDDGTVRTDGNVCVLVYDKQPEKLLTENDIASVNDGAAHTFGTANDPQDLFAVWLTDGNVTVNGDVFWDVACMREAKSKWLKYDDEDDADKKDAVKKEMERLGLDPNNYKDGIDVYGRDDKLKVQFNDTHGTQNVVVNGTIGCFSLNESYKGSATINGDVLYCARYLDETFLNQTTGGAITGSTIPRWVNWAAWSYDGSPYAPEEVYYYSIPKAMAGKIAENGAFTAKVENLKFDKDVQMKGSGIFEDTRFLQTETTMHPEGGEEDPVAGTSAVINDNTLLVNVSKDGFEEDTYPLVRKVSAATVAAIQKKLPATAGAIALAMDIAMIKDQQEAEPDDDTSVNLYFDKIDLSKWKNPVLYHIKDDGTVEEITFKYDAAKKHIQCATDSFSQYVFAGKSVVQQPSGSTTTDSSGGGAPSGGASATPSTETKPDGTKVETSTETKTDGTKVDTTVETKTDGTKTETVVETKTDGAKTETVVETKTDGTKTEIVVETDKDGSVKTTETVTNADGSAVKTEKETERNTKGKEVAVTTTTEKDADGKVTGITQTSEIEQIAGSASATVTVEKTADGKITGAEAEVDKKGASSKQGVKATLSGSVVAQITEAAGTKSVEISMTVTAGKKEYTVKADAQDLEAGNKLKVMALDEKTGEYVLVNAKTYKVNESGNVKLTLPAGMTYQLIDSKEAAAVEKQILATVKVKKSAATISEGKKTALKLSSKLNMDNVAKITYTSAKKSVATVNKNGTITAKNSGSVVIIATVTLKNGKTKTVKMKIKVK